MHMVIRLCGVVSLLLRHKRHWPTASAKTVGVPKDLTSATNFSTLDLWIGHSGRSSGGPVSCFWRMLAASFNLWIAACVVSPPVGRAISVYFQLLILVIKELNIKLKGIVLS